MDGRPDVRRTAPYRDWSLCEHCPSKEPGRFPQYGRRCDLHGRMALHHHQFLHGNRFPEEGQVPHRGHRIHIGNDIPDFWSLCHPGPEHGHGGHRLRVR